MKLLRSILPVVLLTFLIGVPAATQVAQAASGSWNVARAMNVARYGLAGVADDGWIYAIGGSLAGTTLASVEAYNPSGNTWAAVAPMHVARYQAAAAVGNDGLIYVAGGRNTGGFLNSFEVYSPASRAWTSLTAMPTARAGLALATGSDGRIYAIGGYTAAGYLNTVEVYSPWTHSWATAPAMPLARAGLAAVQAANGSIYAIGGVNQSGALSTVDAYVLPGGIGFPPPSTVSQGTWVVAPSLNIARGELAATVGSDGRIYAVGGRTFQAFPFDQGLATVEAYSVGSAAWVAVESMPTARYGLMAALGSDRSIYAVGGMSLFGSALALSERYGLRWTTAPDAPVLMYATPGSVASGASSYVTVGWMPPYDGGSPITGYQVTAYYGTGSTIAATMVVPASVTSAVIANLIIGGSYTFTVKAVNSQGWSAESARSALINLATIPGAPTNVTTAAGIRSLAVSWMPPLSNGGSPITSYIVTASTGVAAETVTIIVNGSTTSTVLTNLINGKTYSVTVTATNALGQGPPSARSIPATLPTVPGAPQALTVTPVGSTLQVRWVAPAFTGGLPITGYLVTVSDGIHAAVAMQVSGTTASFTGLATGQSYTISVVALNAIGAGSSVVQSAILPNLPPVLTVPADQTVHHGDRVTFTVSASDSEDHVVLTASGLPQGVVFTDLGNNTGQVSGNAEVPAGTYPMIVSANDGHNPAVSSTVNITVVRETAQIQLSSQHPTSIAIAKGKTASGSIALRASIRELTDPNGNADIGEAAPVTYTLTPMGGGQTYSFTANRTGGGVEGALQTTALFNHLPPNVYRVHVDIGGSYYQGSADNLLMVYNPRTRGSVTGHGTVTSGAVLGSFNFTSRYTAKGKVQGTLIYAQHRLQGSQNAEAYTMQGAVSGGIVFKSHRAWFLGTATVNGTTHFSFVVSVVESSWRVPAKFGLWVIDPQHTPFADCSFPPASISGGSVKIAT
jgi:hypothetical protein